MFVIIQGIMKMLFCRFKPYKRQILKTKLKVEVTSSNKSARWNKQLKPFRFILYRYRSSIKPLKLHLNCSWIFSKVSTMAMEVTTMLKPAHKIPIQATMIAPVCMLRQKQARVYLNSAILSLDSDLFRGPRGSMSSFNQHFLFINSLHVMQSIVLWSIQTAISPFTIFGPGLSCYSFLNLRHVFCEKGLFKGWPIISSSDCLLTDRLVPLLFRCMLYYVCYMPFLNFLHKN